MNKKIILIIAIIVLIISAYLFFKKDSYLGFYYPDGCLACKEDYIFSTSLDDRASCLNWATNLKQQRNNPGDTFECGKNCKAPNNKDDLYICEETFNY